MAGMEDRAKGGTASAGRVTCLDGLRGVAASTVVVFHFFYAFYPAPFSSYGRTGFSLLDTPLAVLWNGHFSVAVFFAMSGFVLAASAPRTPGGAPLAVVLRYGRLAIPALVSSLIAWAWLTGFPEAGREAQALGGSSWFRWTYQAPIPPIWQAAWEGAVGAFVDGTTRFNNPLWTMRTEFLGSLLIYAAYALVPVGWRVPALAAGLGGLAAAGQFGLAAFCGGALVFEGRGHLAPRPRLGALLALAGVVLGGTYPGHAAGPGLGDLVLSWLGAPGAREAGALLLVLGLLMTPALQRQFDRPLIQRLGELSFPLYLVHVPLICGPAAALFVALAPLSPLGLGLLFVGLAAASLACAILFLLLVERPVLAALRAARTRAKARLAAS
ncbi:MAG: acyltransferase [Rhizobiales bacterium]|nr:acyltransferase [Hyphomicrobiales bacterium]